jgi:hypothetical protein
MTSASINLLRCDVQEVSGRPGDEQRRRPLPLTSGPEGPPHAGDETVQRRDDGRRRRGAPQLVDQAVRRDGPASLQCEQGDQRARATLRERDGYIRDPHLERPEETVSIQVFGEPTEDVLTMMQRLASDGVPISINRVFTGFDRFSQPAPTR